MTRHGPRIAGVPHVARARVAYVGPLVLVMLGACSIKEPDYSDKQCPCPDGWSCNNAIDRCERERAPSDDAGIGDAWGPMSDASLPGESCFVNPRNKLVYASPGFTDFPQGWLQGQGQWSFNGNALAQTNSANPLAYLAHAIPTTNGGANYRIAATMRDLDEVGQGSVGIAFRVQGGMMYLCTYSARRQVLELRFVQNQLPLTLQMGTAVLAEPKASFTMEVNVTGTQLSCCLRTDGMPTLTAQNNALSTGTAGIATLETEGEFSAFYAYE